MQTADLNVTDALCKNAICDNLNRDIAAAIAAQANSVSVCPGQVIIHHRDTDDDVYFLLKGTVIGRMVSETGREVVFTQMRQGTFFGELSALDGHARSVTISAKGDAVLARLRGAQFNALLLAHPALAVNLSKELARRIRAMNERVFGLVVHDVDTRVRLHLMQLAQEQGKLADGAVLENAPTHEEIATQIGANREAVSRAMARFSKAKLITTGRKIIEIRNCDGLLSGLDLAD